ncbi:MAG: hypothetical protein Q9227_003954 [Pyrenula ochraceoflavens]
MEAVKPPTYIASFMNTITGTEEHLKLESDRYDNHTIVTNESQNGMIVAEIDNTAYPVNQPSDRYSTIIWTIQVAAGMDMTVAVAMLGILAHIRIMKRSRAGNNSAGKRKPTTFLLAWAHATIVQLLGVPLERSVLARSWTTENSEMVSLEVDEDLGDCIPHPRCGDLAKLLFTIKKKFLSRIHHRYSAKRSLEQLLERPEEQMDRQFLVMNKVRMNGEWKANALITKRKGDTERFVMRKGLHDESYKITHRKKRGTLVAEALPQAGGSGKPSPDDQMYEVTLAPNMNVAIGVAMVICMHEMQDKNTWHERPESEAPDQQSSE